MAFKINPFDFHSSGSWLLNRLGCENRFVLPGADRYGPSRLEWNFRGYLELRVLSSELRLRGDNLHAWRPLLGSDLN